MGYSWDVADRDNGRRIVVTRWGFRHLILIVQAVDCKQIRSAVRDEG